MAEIGGCTLFVYILLNIIGQNFSKKLYLADFIKNYFT